MATSKSSSSRSGSNGRKSTSTSRNGTKKSTSTRSSGRSASSNRSRTSASKRRQNQPKPIRREVGAVVCLLLAVFSGLNYFAIDAVFINFLGKLLKGLFGYGFWFIPPAFLLAAGILMFHRGRPVKKRVICTFLLPFLLGGLIHLLAVEEKYGLAQIPLLWKNGQEMSCGGAVSGWFIILFSTVFSKIGAAILYLLALFVCNMFITKITPADIVDGLRTAFSAMREYLHSRPGYAEEDYFGSDDDEEERPSRLRRVAKARDEWDEEEETGPEAPPASRRPPVPKRTKRSDIDIPLDESEPAAEPSGVKFDPKSSVRPPHELLEEEEREEEAPFDAPKGPEAPAPEAEAKPEPGTEEKESPVSASATVTTVSAVAVRGGARRSGFRAAKEVRRGRCRRQSPPGRGLCDLPVSPGLSAGQGGFRVQCRRGQRAANHQGAAGRHPPVLWH